MFARLPDADARFRAGLRAGWSMPNNFWKAIANHPATLKRVKASAATRDAKCLGAGRERPQGLSRPFSSRRMWSVSAGF